MSRHKTLCAGRWDLCERLKTAFRGRRATWGLISRGFSYGSIVAMRWELCKESCYSSRIRGSE